jgi:hypothetical protein
VLLLELWFCASYRYAGPPDQSEKECLGTADKSLPATLSKKVVDEPAYLLRGIEDKLDFQQRNLPQAGSHRAPTAGNRSANCRGHGLESREDGDQ